jgi:hypothetical protein
MKKVLTLISCLVMGLMSWAQMPELTLEQHLEDYDFAVKYIEDNYSGFPDKVTNSTLAGYETMRSSLRSQVEQGKRSGWDAVAELMGWFNDAHLKIHYAVFDEQVNDDVNWTEYYRKKKFIHYAGLMEEYNPAPVACKVTDKTFLVRLPSCGGDPDLKWVKNSIKQFKKSHCENLVIDIRGNGGGSDGIWSPYLELLYDHEIRLPGIEYRNSPQNMEYIKNEGLRKDILKMSIKQPDAEFLPHNGGVIRIKGKVDKRVRKAALIIDNKVASAGEQMVRIVGHSSNRTTIYGQDNTRGCLDYSNIALLKFKHSDIYFQVPMSHVCGLPESGIDATGIAPDVRIDLPLPARLTDNIDEWVIWVAEQLEQ